MFEKFFHEVTSPYLWGIILLVSLRAVYSSISKKDFPHAAAFIVVGVVALLMLAASLQLLPPSIAAMFA